MNSRDAVRERSAQVQTQEGQMYLYFSVAVAGDGFEPGQLDEAFESYKEINSDEDTIAVDETTKIPLSVSVELCRRLGGFISCSSTPYSDMSFHVGVPVEKAMDGVASMTAQARVKMEHNPILLSGPILVVGGTASTSDLDSQLSAEMKRENVAVDIVKATNGHEVKCAFDKDTTPSVVIVGEFYRGKKKKIVRVIF